MSRRVFCLQIGRQKQDLKDKGTTEMPHRLNINQLRSELQDLRTQLAAQMGLREEAQIEQAADAMDQIQDAEAREFALQNLDRYARKLRQIEFALRRIDRGEYGVCLDCEKEIGQNRLRAVPWAERCLRCQERADRRGSVEDRLDFEPLLYVT